MAKGKISRLVIQVLKEIGNGRVNETEEKKILGLLKKEDVKDLKYDIALAPVWVQKIMKKDYEQVATVMVVQNLINSFPEDQKIK